MTYILTISILMIGFILGFTLHFFMVREEDSKIYMNGYKNGMNDEFKIIYEIMKKENQNK